MPLSMKDQNVPNSFLIGTSFKPIMGVLYDILLLFQFVLLSDAYLVLRFKHQKHSDPVFVTGKHPSVELFQDINLFKNKGSVWQGKEMGAKHKTVKLKQMRKVKDFPKTESIICLLSTHLIYANSQCVQQPVNVVTVKMDVPYKGKAMLTQMLQSYLNLWLLQTKNKADCLQPQLLVQMSNFSLKCTTEAAAADRQSKCKG